MPKINNSTFLGSSLQIPYYKVISNSEDVTVSPRIFFNDKFLLQSEYRQVFKNSDLILDHSIKLDNENSKNLSDNSNNFINNDKFSIGTNLGNQFIPDKSNHNKPNQDAFDLQTYKKFLLFLKFQEMTDKYNS